MKLNCGRGLAIIVGSLLMVVTINQSFAGSIGGVGRNDVTKILNKDPLSVFDTSSIEGNPISAGTNSTVGKSPVTQGEIKGITEVDTTNYLGVVNSATEKVQNVINFILGLVALISVIYLVIQGLIILFNPEDDKIQDKALNAIKTVAWVIIGIGLTWLIVSLIFHVVGLLTN